MRTADLVIDNYTLKIYYLHARIIVHCIATYQLFDCMLSCYAMHFKFGHIYQNATVFFFLIRNRTLHGYISTIAQLAATQCTLSLKYRIFSLFDRLVSNLTALETDHM